MHSQFRYLGHVLNDDMTDDDDLCREIKNLFVQTNTLLCRFRKCSCKVKLVLFKSFCLNMYDVALWKYYSVTTFNKFKLAFNKCIKLMFGFKKDDSLSGVLMELSVPSVDNIVFNSRVLFAHHYSL